MNEAAAAIAAAARAARAGGDADGALRRFDEVIALGGDGAAVQLERSLCLSALGDDAGALAAAKAAGAWAGEDARLRTRVARRLAGLKAFAEADALAARALADRPDDADALQVRFDAAVGLRQPDLALARLSAMEAAGLSTGLLTAARARLLGALRTAADDAAVVALAQRALHDAPELVVAWRTLGEALVRLGALPRAVAALREGAARTDDLGLTRQLLALLVEQRDPEQGLPIAVAAAARWPDDPVVLDARAAMASETADLRAAGWVEEALARDASTPSAALARWLWLGAYDRVEAWARAAMSSGGAPAPGPSGPAASGPTRSSTQDHARSSTPSPSGPMARSVSGSSTAGEARSSPPGLSGPAASGPTRSSTPVHARSSTPSPSGSMAWSPSGSSTVGEARSSTPGPSGPIASGSTGSPTPGQPRSSTPGPSATPAVRPGPSSPGAADRAAVGAAALARLALWRGDVDGAEDALGRAFALAPGLPAAEAVAVGVLARRGAWAEVRARAAALAARGVAGDPLCTPDEVQAWSAEAALRTGQPDLARAEAAAAQVAAETYSPVAHLLRTLAVAQPRASDPPGKQLDGYAWRAVAAQVGALIPDPALLRSGEKAQIYEAFDGALALFGGNRTAAASVVEADGSLRRCWLGPHPRSHGRRVQQLLRTRPAADVLAAFEALRVALPDEPIVRTYHAETLLWLGRYDEAEAALQRALALSRRTVWAWIGLGACKLYRGDVDGARAAWAEGVEVLGFEGPTLFVYRGEALRAAGELGAARVDLDTAIRSKPHRLSAWLLRALLSDDAGDGDPLTRVLGAVGARCPNLWRDAVALAGEARPRAVAEAALCGMRGNRGASVITMITAEGDLRFYPWGRFLAPQAVFHDFGRPRD